MKGGVVGWCERRRIWMCRLEREGGEKGKKVGMVGLRSGCEGKEGGFGLVGCSVICVGKVASYELQTFCTTCLG